MFNKRQEQESELIQTGLREMVENRVYLMGWRAENESKGSGHHFCSFNQSHCVKERNEHRLSKLGAIQCHRDWGCSQVKKKKITQTERDKKEIPNVYVCTK